MPQNLLSRFGAAPGSRCQFRLMPRKDGARQEEAKKKKTRRGTGAHLLKYYPIGPCKERPFIKILSHWSLQGAKEQMASKRNNSLFDVDPRNDTILIYSCGANILQIVASELDASFSPVGSIFFKDH